MFFDYKWKSLVSSSVPVAIVLFFIILVAHGVNRCEDRQRPSVATEADRFFIELNLIEEAEPMRAVGFIIETFRTEYSRLVRMKFGGTGLTRNAISLFRPTSRVKPHHPLRHA